jgi:hypothetical protein
MDKIIKIIKKRVKDKIVILKCNELINNLKNKQFTGKRLKSSALAGAAWNLEVTNLLITITIVLH